MGTWSGDGIPEIDYVVQFEPMAADIQPCPVVLGQSRGYMVRVWDAVSHRPVNAAVFVNGVPVGQSNLPFIYSFTMKIVRGRDPETGLSYIEQTPPTITVRAPGYEPVIVDLGVMAFTSECASAC
jgi:hypothetical protein